jgi:hypothetical protein
MRFLCLSLLFFFLLAQQVSAQIFQAIVPEEVVASLALNAKSNLPLYEKLRVEDSLYTLLREHYQYLSNEAKLKLGQETKDYDEKVILFKTVRNFRFYLAETSYYFYKFRAQYIKASNLLITEYKLHRDLQALYDLIIIPSASADLYGMLRSSIEACGGTWDRGDFYDPIPRNRN